MRPQTPFDMAHDTPLEEKETVTEVTMTHETIPQPTPATGEYPLSTLSLRLDVEGVSLSWTLRGDDADVARRLPRVLEYIKRLQAKLPRQNETPRPVAVPNVPLEEREDWCPIHGVAMTQQSNERGSWWSHRLADGTGYCKGRRWKAGA